MRNAPFPSVRRATRRRVSRIRALANYPDVLTNCEDVEFLDSRGRRNKKTPVTNAKTLVQIILLLPREQAANFREAWKLDSTPCASECWAFQTY